MELKPGYKQTEVGVIPSDWEVTNVEREVTSGPENGYSGRSNPDAAGTLTLSLAATTSGRLQLNPQTVKRLERLVSPDSRLFLVPGDVLVQRSNTAELVGTTAIFDGPAKTYVYPDLMMRLRFRRPGTAAFFWRFCNSVVGRRFFTASAAGSTGTMPKISGATLRQMPIPLPPLREQEAIAEALSDADALIESLEKLIQKKRAIKQGAMQELLTGKRRLPGFTGKWEEKRLGEVLQTHPSYGINAPAVPFSDSLPRYIRITDIDSFGRFSSSEPVSVDHRDSAQYFLEEGDLVFARTGASVGKSYRYSAQEGPLVFAGFLIRLRTNPKLLLSDFLFEFVQSYEYWNWVGLMSMRSGQPGINGREFGEFRMRVPGIGEQQAIVDVFRGLTQQIEALEEKVRKMRRLKQGMMQELLTGRVRLV